MVAYKLNGLELFFRNERVPTGSYYEIFLNFSGRIRVEFERLQNYQVRVGSQLEENRGSIGYIEHREQSNNLHAS